MAVAMPAAVVLIVCKTVLLSEPDPNEGFTNHENRDWAIEHGMMTCRRLEVQMTDIDEIKGAKEQPFTMPRCMRAAIMLIPQWDRDHKSSPYRAWRVACPVPIRSGPKESDPIIGWKMPECGHRDTVICEVDTAI